MILTRVDRHIRVARAVVEAVSPLHIGSGRGDEISDADVVRDMNGLPTIPGSSLTGVLRQMFRDVAGRSEREQKVFGHQSGDDGHGSRLTVSFGLVLGGDGRPVEGLLSGERRDDPVLEALSPRRTPLRRHVRIDHRGVADAAGHGLFDERLVPAGCRFLLELGLVGDGPEYDADFETILGFLAAGFRLGGHTRRGLGLMRLVRLEGRRFDLMNPADRTAFAKVPVSLAEEARGLATLAIRPTAAACPRVRLRFRPRTPWAIGCDGPWGPQDTADVTAYREGWIRWNGESAEVGPERVVVPATAIKGVLAHRVAWHDHVLAMAERSDREAALKLVGHDNESVAALFGAAPDGGDGDPATAGIVLLADAVVDPTPTFAATDLLHHSGIDRFTGGVRSGVLFSERLLRPGTEFETTLEIDRRRTVPARAKEALRRALEDLAKGRWQLGCGYGRGHGWVDGSVEWLSGADWLQGTDA